MAVSGAIQSLIAAFFFGILFNAASAASVLYIKGHGSTIFRDGLRLVLILFLLSSTSWALGEFLTTLIESTAARSTCQVAIIFTSLSDQLGRVFIEQYLVWAIRKDGAKTAFDVSPQILVFGRLVFGIAFVAVTRVDFQSSACLPVYEIGGIAYAVIALDAVILTLLAIQASRSDSKKNSSSEPQIPRRIIVLLLVGSAIWLGTSVTLLVGIATIDIFFRTSLPAIGWIILVALVATFFQVLVVPRRLPRRPDSPTSHGADGSRDISSSDSSMYPPSRYEDIKDVNTIAITAFTVPDEIGQRNMKGDLPLITNPVTGVSGVGGLPVQGQLFPPARGMTEALAIPALPQFAGGRENVLRAGGKQKKGTIRSKGPINKLAISNPVINDNLGLPNPLKRIPTVDLATAADNDKVRRAKNAQRFSALIAQRPAPRPPSPPGASNGAQKFPQRKGLPPVATTDVERPGSSKTNETSGALSIHVNASSTATQLSPGIEAVRRRSPRYSQAPPLASKTQVIKPGEPVRIPIPRHPAPTQAVPTPIPEPEKTPLQRRPTIGLPSNPRAQAMKALAKETQDQRQQTVMFVNNIVYNDPGVVNSIVQVASKTPAGQPDSADSVLHRPRPIPRNSDKVRLVFPTEVSPNQGHRRSRSGGSLTSRKSILRSMPGSPTNLPPLPPPPKTAGAATRPLPNDTKSMTFDEKMTLLYSTPSSAPTTAETVTKRLFIPELPPIPVGFMDEVKRLGTEEQSDEIFLANKRNIKDTEMRASKSTDRSTMRTASILGVDEMPARSEQNGYLESGITADELGSSWLPGIKGDYQRHQSSTNTDIKRKSSPILPTGRQGSTSSYRSDIRTQDEQSTTAWGSVYSPVAAVDVNQSRQNARSTYIQKGYRNSDDEMQNQRESKSGDEVMIVLLDTSTEYPQDNRQSFYLDDDEESPAEAPVPTSLAPRQFHHRLGDECPTFSARKDKGRSRKMPAPTPLLLHRPSTKRMVLVQPAEPSPLESPGVAYQAIQEQLKNFEQPNRESRESQMHRLALLEDLEREMGQLENKWQSTQNRLDRNSTSTMHTTPSNSRPVSTVEQQSRRSLHHQLTAERRASRRSRMRSGVSSRSRDDENLTTPSSQGSGSLESLENVQSSSWQIRLAEAQSEYLDNAPNFIMKRNNLKFLSVSKAGLGSPSPPETDGSDSEGELRQSAQLLSASMFQSFAPVHELWKPNRPNQQTSQWGLWTAPVRKSVQADQMRHFAQPLIRSHTRTELPGMSIESVRLWQRPTEPVKYHATHGLWKKPVQPQPKAARPVTVRPPRKSRRITMLPDIVENPEPLPDKRGTLGIFQFPWGEKSEHPTVQYRSSQMPMAMPGTMTTGRPISNASLTPKVVHPETAEYSSSFFDEYDEEGGDSFDGFSGSDDEGDDFDETTLWEIASLLKTEQVPSRQSLLPQAAQESAAIDVSVLADFVTDMTSEDESDSEMEMDRETVPEEPVPVEGLSGNLNSKSKPSLLWNPKSNLESLPIQGTLPQSDKMTWEMYMFELGDPARPRTHGSHEESQIGRTGLWKPKRKTVQPQNHSLLWAQLQLVKTSSFSPPQQPVYSGSSNGMWTPMAGTSSQVNANVGLSQPDNATWDCYISKNGDITRMRSYQNGENLFIESSTLWAPIITSINSTDQATLWKADKLQASVLPVSPVQHRQDVSGLWAQPAIISTVEIEGLFNLHHLRATYRTTTKEPIAIATKVKHPRKSEGPLSKLTTMALWTRGTQASKTGVEWLFALQKTTVPSQQLLTSAMTQPGKLWMEPAIVVDSEFEGLYNFTAARSEYRRTSKLPAAITMVTKTRSLKEDLTQLATREMWAMQRVSKKNVAGGKVSLWTNPSLEFPVAKVFQLDPHRTDYRTTGAEPAALYLISKPRAVVKPLQKLQSTTLWVQGQSRQVEHDWIALSSTRLTIPHVASVSMISSSPKSPITDDASVKSITTKASAVAEPANSGRGFFKSLFGRARKLSDAPKVPELVKLRAQPKAEPDLPEGFVIKNLDEISLENPAYIPMRHQFRTIVAYQSDWDSALNEALVARYPVTMAALRASYPKSWEAELQEAIKASHVAPKITRRRTTPREWSSALQSAIAASHPELRLSRGQALPCQWDAELHEAITRGQGRHVNNSFDVSVRHPVFFGSLITQAETVHPALKGYRIGTKQSKVSNKMLLWTKPFATTASQPTGLWTPSTGVNCLKSDPTAFKPNSNYVERYPRKARVPALDAEIPEDIDLWEQSLWSRYYEPSRERNWLGDTVKRRFTRIELRY